MSTIIKTVAYEADKAKHFREKLGEHLGIHLLTVTITEGESIEGILSEVGSDYISLVVDDHDLVVPITNILYFSYSH